TIANVGTATLDSVAAEVAGQTISLGRPLAPGETASIEIPTVIQPDQQNAEDYGYGGQPASTSLAALTASTKGIVVKAKVENPSVGPGIGTAVEDRQDVTLAFFTGLHVGKVDL
ncbi:MAG TPA: hypothetical protein VG820_04580, partial [Fimbriimonadaceae bacterium]|nr:hypothetical protein [Fimbriimonadaceae bacterium]